VYRFGRILFTVPEQSVMAKRNQYTAGKKTRKSPANDGRTNIVREAPVYQRKEKVQYGKPFIVMEDAEKNTYAYNGSAWVPYGMSMADCLVHCEVKVLPQKVNGKTRYEVRAPLA
jgi:hypothetical protein